MTPLRIVVAEDDAIIGMLLENMLTSMGHTVCAVSSSQSRAVAAAAQHQPDLMIVDGALGQGSGISAIDEILSAGAVRHLFITGDRARVQSLRPNAVVLQKPFNEPALAEAIERAMVAPPAA